MSTLRKSTRTNTRKIAHLIHGSVAFAEIIGRSIATMSGIRQSHRRVDCPHDGASQSKRRSAIDCLKPLAREART
jgi:hypothetical protein